MKQAVSFSFETMPDAQASEVEAFAARLRFGTMLGLRRRALKIKQADLALVVGWKYQYHISEVESAKRGFPSDKLTVWASALQVDPAMFAKEYLRAYEPQIFEALFPEG